MIVKVHARGSGGGSGPVEYLLGKDGDREGATLDRGNPKEIEELIDSSPYAKKYTSGVLSFAEADLDRKTKDNLMSSFEKALLPGLDADQYSCLWVEHRDKGRLELNFVVPNIELQTGKRLQPYYHRADKPRINAWKV
ncbi:relaxase/mobilization nuclease domain-containing protein, partial [Moritella viscosa]